jgi:serine/threonine-protein kinase
LTGEVAFTGAFTTIMHRVLNDKAPPPSALNVQVPQAFDAVIQRAMAKRPDERYQSAAEFKDAIIAAQAARTNAGAATAGGTVVRMPGNAPPAAGAGAAPPAPSPWLTPVKLFGLLGLVVVGLAAAGSWWYLKGSSTVASNETAHRPASGLPSPGSPGDGTTTAVLPTGGAPSAAPSAATAGSPPPSAIVTAVGVANPADPKLATVPGGATQVVNDDAREQIVAKAAALYVEPESLNTNYPLIRAKLLSRHGEFISDVVQQSAPQVGGNGLMTGTVSAKVNLREVQQALNTISREDRVDFIRNNGNPRISVTINAAVADDPDGAPPARSAVAENILKERIRSFGFTVVDDDAAPAADFRITGEVHFKRLAARLPASGLVIEKFALTSWTVNAADAKSGEEIYHNTAIPEKQSWATKELALQDVGRLIGTEFNKNFFLEYFDFKPTRVRLRVSGLPAAKAAALLAAVNSSLVVMNAVVVPSAGTDIIIDADLSGGAAPVASTVERGILTPLNGKMGSSCFTTVGATGTELHIALAPSCLSPGLLDRLDNANIRSAGAPVATPQHSVQAPGSPPRVTT